MSTVPKRSDVQGPPVDKDKIYIDAQHGLGNRLRAIASAAAIAQKVDRELVIVWQPDHHCDCRFSDLFDYRGNVVEQSAWPRHVARMNVYNYMEIEPGAAKDAEITLTDGQDAYVRSAYVLNNPNTGWETENEFLAGLTPSAAVTDLVRKFDLEGHVGVHIRMLAGEGLDHNSYDSPENWTAEGHALLHKWRASSHYNNFIRRIDRLLESNPGTSLFLAADMPEIYAIFAERYGKRIEFLARGVFDRSKEQIIFGLADAILLSKCSSLLGSTWSSFTELAIRLSKNYSSVEMSGKDF